MLGVRIPKKTDFFRKTSKSCFFIKYSSRYLDSFIGEKVLETEWVKEKIESLGDVVESVVEMSKYVPQSVYVGMQRALQQEWILYNG